MPEIGCCFDDVEGYKSVESLSSKLCGVPGLCLRVESRQKCFPVGLSAVDDVVSAVCAARTGRDWAGGVTEVLPPLRLCRTPHFPEDAVNG